MVAFYKKPREPFGCDLLCNCIGINAVTRGADGIAINVRCKDLQLNIALAGDNRFAEQHRQRISLFAGAASRNPDAYGQPLWLVAHHIGQSGFGQHVEHRRIPEKTGHVDQQIFRQQFQLNRIGSQSVQILWHFIQPR